MQATELSESCALTGFQQHLEEQLDLESYERMLDAIEYAETVEAIRQGLEDVEQGRIRPAKEFFEVMRKEFNIPAKL